MHQLKLRGYQREAIAAALAKLEEHTRTAVVLPTGMGKTVVFSHLIAQTVATGKVVLVLVHRDELAEQAKDKMQQVAPDAQVGIVKAERNEVEGRDVIVASVQTLARERRRFALTDTLDNEGKRIGLVIVDECHHAVARTWQLVLSSFGCFRPVSDPERVPAIGFTATLARTDGIGLGDVWQSVAYERDIVYGIEHGYLVDVRGQQVTVDGLDLATIARSRGDYQDGALGDALEASGAGEVIAEAYQEHAAGKQGILFAPTVSSAFTFAEAMNAAGIVTEVITGETSKEDRELTYKKFRSGDVQVLANCMVLTEGFDAPHAEVAVIARPTQSAPLYTQMVGRVLRPLPGKPEKEALILDVVGIAGSHRLRSLTDLVKTEVKEGESVTEAQERVAKEHENTMERTRISGQRASRIVELFAASHSVWLQTKGGTQFIPVRGGQVVLWEKADGRYSVGVKMQREQGRWLYHDMELEYAMSWGEQIASDIDPMVADKDRSWRRTKPSQAQLDLAMRLRLAPADELVNMRKGAISDLLSVHFASRELKALDAARAKLATR